MGMSAWRWTTLSVVESQQTETPRVMDGGDEGKRMSEHALGQRDRRRSAMNIRSDDKQHHRFLLLYNIGEFTCTARQRGSYKGMRGDASCSIAPTLSRSCVASALSIQIFDSNLPSSKGHIPQPEPAPELTPPEMTLLIPS